MFSLIITIISIALVAALALASIYYGGDAFTKGSDGAAAARLINEGQQLQGARTLANAEGAFVRTVNPVTTLAGLAPGYLSQVPAGNWTTDGTVAGNIDSGTVFSTTSNVSEGICKELNKKAGLGDGAVTALGDHIYGCITADKKVQYRY